MKQKITKINWVILGFVFIVEFVLLNVILKSNLDISLYNNPNKFLKVLTVCISIDIIFILYVLDFSINTKKVKNIMKIYNEDVNFLIPKVFWLIEIIKGFLIMYSIGHTVLYYELRYMSIVYLYIGIICLYYILYSVMPQKDNIKRKLKKLQKDIKKLKTNFNFILIDGDVTPSSFELERISGYKISKNNIYINLKNEFPKIEDNNLKKMILDNTVCIIHELEKIDLEMISEIYQNQQINNTHMYHVFAVDRKEKNELTGKFSYIHALKICDLNSVIEFVESIFLVNDAEQIAESEYKKINKNISKIDKSNSQYIENLNKIYQYKFNNRLKQRVDNIPKEGILFELYRNAMINDSPYQSVLIFFNYITVMGKLVEYYLYAKNNPKFDKNKIKKAIIGDNPPIWNNHILLNIYKNKENILYKNLREKVYKLNEEEKILINVYLSDLLNVEILGDEITYDGIMNLFIQFRNKVEAHGIISDANVYAVWNLTCFFANTLNKIFKITELKCEYDCNELDVKIGYLNEESVFVGKYILYIDDVLCFVKDKDIYINYFTGEIIPVIENKG